MPQREVKAYLLDILGACDAVERYTQGADLIRYRQDDMLRSAVERQLFIIGEAINQIRQLEPLEVHTLGDVAGIVTVRNILTHVYFGVKHEIIWDIVTRGVPKLRLAAQEWTDSLR